MKKITLTALFIGLMSIGTTASATPFNISMVADNDFAIFSGTSTGINNLLYQNDVVWNAQINPVPTYNFNLAAGDDVFYVLAMGGGGSQENLSGEINGINITAIPSASMSSNLSGFLTGYNASNVANGTYDASLLDVQNAFSGLTWGAPALDSSQIVIQQAGFWPGIHFRYQHGTFV